MKNRKLLLILVMVLLLLPIMTATLFACGGETDLPKEYTVTFDDLNGNLIERKVKEQSRIEMPANPTNFGYSFGGWFFDKDIWTDGINSETFVTRPISDNVTVYARWNIVKVTVKFFTAVSTDYRTFTEDFGTLIDLEDPVRADYNFMGWYKAITTNPLKLDENTRLTLPHTIDFIITTTYYAKWEAKPIVLNKYTVKFDTGKDASLINDYKDIVENTTITKPANPVRMYYLFDAWYKDSALTTLWNFATDKVNGNITLYAKWLENAGIIAFHTNAPDEEITGAAMNDQIIELNVNTPLSANTFVRYGYTFLGWSDIEVNALTAKQSDVVYTDLQTIRLTTLTTKHLYAVWSVNRFNVSVSYGMGSVSQVAFGTLVTVKPTAQAGKIFTSWTIVFTASDSKKYNVEYEYNELTQEASFRMPDGHTDCTAVFAVNNAEIIFDKNNPSATGTMPNKSASKGFDVILYINTYKLTGYAFDGWVTSPEKTLAEYADGTIYKMPEDKATVTLYALWKKETYKLEIDGCTYTVDGVANKPNALYDSVIVVTPTPKAGFTFASFSVTVGSAAAVTVTSNPYTFNMPDGKVIITVNWTANLNTLKFDKGFTVVSPTDVVTMSDVQMRTEEKKALPTCTFERYGFIFLGWAESPTATKTDYSNGSIYTMGPEPVYTLYALWKERAFSITVTDGYINGLASQTGNEYLKEFTLTPNTLKHGYTFSHWVVTYVDYLSGATVSVTGTTDANFKFKFTMPAGHVTAKLLFTANINTIIFDKNHIDAVGSMANQLIATDDTANLNALGFSLTGYDFVCWEDIDNNFKQFLDGAAYKMGVESQVTLKAKWIEKKYNLSVINGSPSNKYDYGTLITVTAKDLPGRTFLYWNINGLVSSQFITGSTTDKTFSFIMPDNDITAEAVYQALAYTYVFNTNGGTAISNITANFGENITPPPTVKSGYIFDGWAPNVSLEGVNVGFPLTIDENAIKFATGNVITVYAKWTSATQTPGLKFSLINSNGAYSVAMGEATATNIVIPDAYQGKPVTAIAIEGFKGATLITSISIPSSVTSIGSYAFDGCTMLASLEISGSVTYLGSNALIGCTSLTNLKIPVNFVSAIGSLGLMTLELTESTDNDKFMPTFTMSDKSLLDTVIIGDKITTVAVSAFANCLKLQTLILGNDIREINNKAFLNCPLLGYVLFPQSLLRIGEEAFKDCSALTDFIIPSGTTYGVTTIEKSAFEKCTSLTDIVIPETVTYFAGSVPETVFSGCFVLSTTVPTVKRLTLPVNFARAIYNTQITDLILTKANDGTVMQSNVLMHSSNRAALKRVIVGVGIDRIADGVFEGLSELTTVTFLSNTDVKYIGANSFKDCVNLNSIVLPGSVLTIGASAFEGCISLPALTLPDGLNSIGIAAFRSCKSLVAMTIPQSVKTVYGADQEANRLFYGCTSLTQLTIPVNFLNVLGNPPLVTLNITESTDGSFIMPNMTWTTIGNLVNLSIAANITTISNGAFANAVKLINVSISGANLVSIGQNAFYNCKLLTSISLPNSVSSIGISAFEKCVSLSSFVIPELVTVIPANLFNGCISLTGITLFNTNAYTSNLVRIDYGAFTDCTAITEIEIPSTIKTITFDSESNMLFQGCVNLRKLSIPVNFISALGNAPIENLTIKADTNGNPVMPEFTLKVKSALLSVVVADTITTISDSAFMDCKNLISFTIPDSILIIGEYAFYNCEKLSSANFRIPPKIESIGEHAFTNCKLLKEIVLPGTLDSIGGTLFIGCTGIETLTVPVNYIASLSADMNIKTLSIAAPTNGDTEMPIKMPTYVNLKTVEIQNSITTISDEAFKNCVSLTDVTIPDSIKIIGQMAFQGCTVLKNLALTNLITSIGDYAFDGCSSLAVNTVPSSLTSIGDFVFRNCVSIFIMNIPSTVQKIGKSAFAGCSSMTTLVIPRSVLFLGESNNFSTVIANCSALTRLTVPVNFINIIGDCKIEYLTLLESSSSVKSMPDFTMTHKDSLINVIISSGITTISANAFLDATSLNYVSIPDTISGIAAGAFKGCKELTDIITNGNITSIGDNAFNGCVRLKTFQMSRTGITSYGEGVFMNCASLPYFTDYISKLPFVLCDYTIKVNDNAFNGCVKLIDFDLPSTLSYIGRAAFNNCTTFTKMVVPDTVTTVIVGSNVSDLLFSGCTGLIELSIPVNFATMIGNCPLKTLTFRESTSLVKAMPEGITNILSLVKVIIMPGVTTVSAYAFKDCSKLTTVTLPASITNIGVEAFRNCVSLSFMETASGIDRFELPANLSIIGDFAFYSCLALPNLTLPSTLVAMGVHSFNYCSSFTEMVVPKTLVNITTYIGSEMLFNGCVNIKELTLPVNYLAIIGNMPLAVLTITESSDGSTVMPVVSAEFSKNALTTLIISGNITSISAGAFKDCTVLSSVSLTGSIANIGAGAFENCSALTSITLPSSLAVLGAAAFKDCVNLTDITLPAGVTALSDSLFENCAELVTVTINGTALTIGQKAFMNAQKLTAVNNVASVTSIGSYAFANCTSLERFTIPTGVTVINDSTFLNCVNLKYLLDGSAFNLGAITTLAANALNNCRSIEAVIVPNTVTLITGEVYDKLFDNCINLTDLTIPLNLINYIGACPLTKLSLTASSVPGAASGIMPELTLADKSMLTDVIIADGAKSISKNAFLGATNLANLTLPDSIETIEQSAFENCVKLVSFNIPFNLKTIGVRAFYNCVKIADFTFNLNIAYIGDAAFGYCTSLTQMVIPSSVLNVSANAITDRLFYGCDKLTKLTLPVNFADKIGNSPITELILTNSTSSEKVMPENVVYVPTLTKLIVGSGVTSISSGAFDNCTLLNDITLPATLLRIESFAFSGCSGLQSFTFPDNVSYIGDNAFFGCGLLKTLNFSGASTLNQIGAYSFTDCFELEITDFPNALQVIGESAFENCVKITTLAISSGVMTIHANAFKKAGIQTLTINGTALTYIGESAFEATKITSLVLPQSVRIIRNRAFADCVLLATITLPRDLAPSSQTNSEFYNTFDSVLSNCVALTNITVPSGNMYLIDLSGVLYSRDKTVLIKVPSSYGAAASHLDYTNKGNAITNYYELDSNVISVNANAFADCTQFSNLIITWAATNFSIANVPAGAGGKPTVYYKNNEVLFDSNKTTLVRYPEKIPATKYSIPNGITIIEERAFNGNLSIEVVEFCSTITSVNGASGSAGTVDSFGGCTNLKTFITNGGSYYTAIDGILYSYDKLTLIRVPLNYFGTNFYYKNTNLTNCLDLYATMSKTVSTFIKPFAFDDCLKIEKVIMPELISTKHGSINEFGKETSPGVFRVDVYYMSVGALYNRTETQLIWFSPAYPSGVFTVRQSTQTIDSDAFENCSNITAFAVQSGHSYFAVRRFDGTEAAGATGVLFDIAKTTIIAYPQGATNPEYRMPENIISIRQTAFKNCGSLKVIYFSKDSVLNPDGTTKASFSSLNLPASLQESYISYDNGVLFDMTFKTILKLSPTDTRTSYSIPVGINEIAENAFFNTKLITITIPESVLVIKESWDSLTALTTFIVDVNNPNFASDDGILYGLSTITVASLPVVEKTTLIRFPINKNLTTYTLLPTLGAELTDFDTKTFAPNAFNGAKYLRFFAMPSDNSYAINSRFKVSVATAAGTDTWQKEVLPGILFNSDTSRLIRMAPRYFLTATEYYCIGNNVNTTSGTITLAYPLKAISEYAFESCEYVTKITVPGTITMLPTGPDIGINTFYNCKNLTEVVYEPIPDTKQTFDTVGGYTVFYKDSSKSEITRIIGNSAGTSFIVPDSVVTIAAGVFSGRTNITSITFGEKLSDYNDLFECLINLTTVSVYSTNTIYAANGNMLYSKDFKTLIRLPRAYVVSSSAITPQTSITKIEKDAFFGCKNITASVTLTLPFNTDYNGCYFIDRPIIRLVKNGSTYDETMTVLYLASNVSGTYTIENSVKIVADGAFAAASNITQLIIGSNVESIADALAGLTKVQSYALASGNTNFYVDSFGVLYDKTKTVLIRFPVGSGMTTYTFKKEVLSMRKGATKGIKASLELIFENIYFQFASDSDEVTSTMKRLLDGVVYNFAMTELIDVDDNITGEFAIPYSVQSVQSTAFSGSKISALIIDIKTERFGSGIEFSQFESCVNLERFIVAPGHPKFSSLNGILYNDSKSILYKYPKNCALTSLTITSATTTIHTEAFRGIPTNSLQTVYVPSKQFLTANESLLGVAASIFIKDSQSGVMFDRTMETLISYPASSTVKEYTIPIGVKTVNAGAFEDCVYLEKLTIPNTVTTINENFNSCTNLKSFAVDGVGVYSVTNNILFKKEAGATSYTLVRCPVGNKITTYTLDGEVGFIANYAFYNCSLLREVTMPIGTSYAAYSFDIAGGSIVPVIYKMDPDIGAKYNADLTVLYSISKVLTGNLETLPDSLITIEADAFTYAICNNANVTGVTLPKNVRYIYADLSVFTFVKAFVVNADNQYYSAVDGVLFNKTKTYLIKYPASKPEKSYDIPASVDTVADNAFNYAIKIATENFIVDSRVLLTSLVLPDGLTLAKSFKIIKDGVTFNYAETILERYPINKAGMYVIPSTVVEIASGAFTDCNYLTSLTIPASVLTINGYFQYCRNLESIIVLAGNLNFLSIDGVLYDSTYRLLRYPSAKAGDTYIVPQITTSINSYAFYSNRFIKNFTIYTSVTNWNSFNDYFYGGTPETDSIVKYVINNGALKSFDGKILISVDAVADNYTIDAGVQTVLAGAFKNYTTLKKITIPASVLYIYEDWNNCPDINEFIVNAANPNYASKNNALYDKSMTTLLRYPPAATATQLKFETGLTAIYAMAFYGNKNLTTITLPSTVANYANVVFTNITTKYITIDEVLFDESRTVLIMCPTDKAGAYIVPESCTTILADAFENCILITSFTVGKNVTVINETFDTCIKIGQFLVAAGNSTFSSIDGALYSFDRKTLIRYPLNKTATEFEFASTLVTVKADAFIGNYHLTTLVVPYGFNISHVIFEANVVTRYVVRGGVWFTGDLTELIKYPETLHDSSYVIPDGTLVVWADAFKNAIYLSKITFNASLTTVYETFTTCSSLAEFEVASGNTSFSTLNGVLYNYTKTRLIKYPQCKYDLSFDILLSVTDITDYAFSGVYSLAEMTITADLSDIDLTSHIFGNRPTITRYVDGVRYDEMKETLYRVPTDKTGVFIVPSTVKTIEAGAFDNCLDITEIVIPASVTRINCIFSSLIALEKFTVAAGNAVYSSSIISGALTNRAGANYNLICYPSAKTDTELVITSTAVVSINTEAFDGVKYLKKVTIPDTIPNYNSITFPVSITTIHLSVGGVIYSRDKKDLIKFNISATEYSIPSGTARIMSGAFASNTTLENLIIPSSVTVIDEDFHTAYALKAFDVNTLNAVYSSLNGVLYNKVQSNIIKYPVAMSGASFTIPESVQTIDTDAFKNEINVDTIYITGTYILTYHSFGAVRPVIYRTYDEMMYDENLTVLIKCPTGKTGAVTIASQVVTIAANAFDGCTKITKLTIQANVTSILATFETLTELQEFSVSAANTVYSSVNGALYTNSGKKLLMYPIAKSDESYEIQSIVTDVSIDAFANARYLIILYIPVSVSGYKSLNYSAKIVEKYIINDSVRFDYEQEELLSYGQTLTKASYIVPEGTLRIASKAFASIYLTNLTLPASLLTLSDTLDGCTSLNTISVAGGNTVYKSIAGVLYSADGLILIRYPIAKGDTKFKISTGVTSIAADAFNGCKYLTELTIPSTVLDYSGVKFSKVITTKYITIDEVLFNEAKTVLLSCPTDKAGAYIIPEGTVEIATGAFTNCTLLTSISIPQSVTKINAYFYTLSALTEFTVNAANLHFASDNGLLYQKSETFNSILYSVPVNYPNTELTLPVAVEYFNTMAFYNCKNIVKLTIYKGVLNYKDASYPAQIVKYISNNGSIYDYNEKTLYAVNTALTGIFEIPQGVTKIADGAFNGCTKITSIKLPSSVNSLENLSMLFRDCIALTAFEVDSANATYAAANGVLLSKDLKTLYCYPMARTETNGVYNIYKDVETIYANAFYGNTTLTLIVFTAKVAHITPDIFPVRDASNPLTVRVINKSDFYAAGFDNGGLYVESDYGVTFDFVVL